MKKSKRRSSKLTIVAIFLIVFGTGALIAQRAVGQLFSGIGGVVDWDAPAAEGGEVSAFVVEPGDTATSIGARLQERGLIRSALAFRMLARSRGEESMLAVGMYQLTPSMRPSEMLELMSRLSGEPGIKVTFPEGWQVFEMADRLEASGVISSTEFLHAVTGNYDYSFLAGRPAGMSLEGFLFPDTYLFQRKTTAAEIVDAMLRNFDRRFDISLRQQAERQGLSVAQVVTLASIVEREAVAAEERPMIAEVFLNRLALRMLLQADPTVQYAMARADPVARRAAGYWKYELTHADLESDSPYNTYKHRGLPPTAIANPGLASLKAVVAPTSTGYLYFVAKSDGTHAFARTLAEHNENVSRFQSLSRAR